MYSRDAISKLPEEQRQKAHRIIHENLHSTIDVIKDLLEEDGLVISRAALGRHIQKIRPSDNSGGFSIFNPTVVTAYDVLRGVHISIAVAASPEEVVKHLEPLKALNQNAKTD